MLFVWWGCQFIFDVDFHLFLCIRKNESKLKLEGEYVWRRVYGCVWKLDLWETSLAWCMMLLVGFACSAIVPRNFESEDENSLTELHNESVLTADFCFSSSDCTFSRLCRDNDGTFPSSWSCWFCIQKFGLHEYISFPYHVSGIRRANIARDQYCTPSAEHFKKNHYIHSFIFIQRNVYFQIT